MRHARLTLLALMTCTLVGCRASSDAQPATRAPDAMPRERRTRSEADTIRDFAQQIHNSRDRIEEAAALRRLQEYLSDRSLTFNVFGQRAADDAVVRSLSTQSGTLRVRLDVYRGQEPIQSFTFIPRDNRNLTLLGQ
ncbi:hypothetical protein BH09PLA1_BH09PLA1_37110 [soil metagenome]